MKILLTGVTGYIGKRLLPVLLEEGHEVVCCVRDKRRFDGSRFQVPGSRLIIIEVNFLEEESLKAIPEDIDAAYYLIHSMSASTGDFVSLEKQSALNFRERIRSDQGKTGHLPEWNSQCKRNFPGTCFPGSR